MNQIICTSSTSIDIANFKKNYRKRNMLRFEFFVLIIIYTILIIYYLFFRYKLYNAEKFSKNLAENYKITKIYSTSPNSNSLLNNSQKYFYNNITYEIIGIIEIKKLSITYPIISDINKELLKIAPCKICGPNPNQTGNLCIAAHNYRNDTFFSNISKLKNGDIISIYDNLGNYKNYIISNIYKTDEKDLSCINQNTDNLKIITLITCDNFDNSKRIIVKAIEETNQRGENI